MEEQFLLQRIFIVLVLASNANGNSTNSCPQETDLLRRLGDTRFYIVQKNERGNYVSQDKAEEQCKTFGLTMAKITNMRTFAVVGRNLEKVVSDNQLKDTWYWMPAYYDSYFKYYRWSDTRDRIKFHNFLYRKTRPTGIAAMVNYNNVYEINRGDPQCLAVALPWFGPCEDSPSYDIRGNQFIVEERPCESVKTRHVICESKLSKCNSTKQGPFLLTEDKVDYFETGHWILGNRTFIINWEVKLKEDSVRYCEKLKMKLYEPLGQDDGLIPFLKMWSRDVTMTTFWTDMIWFRKDEEYRYKNKTKVSGKLWRDYFDEETGKVKRVITPGKPSNLSSRDSKLDNWFCVSMGLAYEFGGQTPCSAEMLNSSMCKWHFREFSPTSCKNYHATICSSNENKLDLQWDPKWTDNVNLALNASATLPFGVYNNNYTRRSTYKQTFGSLVCPPEFQMLRIKNTKWHPEPRHKNYFEYDYLETYWVLDEEFFNKNINSNCTVTLPGRYHGFDRIFKKVPCSEWHFYLCQRIPIKRSKSLAAKVNPWKEMIWKEGPQERSYPILLEINTTVNETIPQKIRISIKHL